MMEPCDKCGLIKCDCVDETKQALLEALEDIRFYAYDEDGCVHSLIASIEGIRRLARDAISLAKGGK